MKQVIIKIFFFSAFALLSRFDQVAAQIKADAITGTWLPASGKNSHVIIYKQGNKYYGKLQLLQSGTFLDAKNPDPTLRSRSLSGLIMLNEFEFDGHDTWQNGTLYDPNTGKTYSCKISLNSLNELKVRGYIGISLFGRTEVFTRISS